MSEEVKHEKFEYDGIKNKLLELKNNYTDYVNAINKIDLILSSETNVSSESALYNEQGSNIVSLWDNYCSKSKGFLYVFEKWTDMITTIYNNNIEFEANKAEDIKIDDVDLEINATTYTQEEIDLLARLLNGDSTIKGTIVDGIETITIAGITYQIIRDGDNIVKVINVESETETIHHRSSYEEEINAKYSDYQAGKITDAEWTEYINSLPQEQREYATILSTGSLVVSATDVESILNKEFDNSSNMAEQAAANNRMPEGWVVSPDSIEDPFMRRHDFADDFYVWSHTGISNYSDGEYYYIRLITGAESDSYVKKEEYIDENGNKKTKYVAYIHGEEYKTYDRKPGFEDYEELWKAAYPNVCHVVYTEEGQQAFDSYKKNLSNIYEQFLETHKLILNEEEGIFYSDTDQCIHYPDGSILQLDDKEYSWTYNFFLFSGINEEVFEELFMTANGYVSYELDERCEGY